KGLSPMDSCAELYLTSGFETINYRFLRKGPMSTYAVIKTGGKQYRVAEGETVKVEKLPGDPGAKVEFTDVLMVASGADVKIGKPLVAGAKVSAEIVEQDRERKIIVFKYKRRKNFRKRGGHRQPFTALKITGIKA